MKFINRWFFVKTAIIISTLPFAAWFSSFFILKAFMAVGLCAPYEDIVSGNFVCEMTSFFRLFYIILMPSFYKYFIGIFVFGFVSGALLFMYERSNRLDLDIQKKLKILSYFLVYGFLFTLLFIYTAISQHYEQKSLNEVLATLKDTQDSGNIKVMESLDHIPSSAELYKEEHNNSYAGFCEDSAVVSIKNRNLSYLECMDSESMYRVSAMLFNGKQYCVDSLGSATTTIPATKKQVYCDPDVTQPISATASASSSVPHALKQPTPKSTDNQETLKFIIVPPDGWNVDKSGLYGTVEIISDPTSNNQANIYVVGTVSGPTITLETAASQSKRNLLNVYKDFVMLSDENKTVNGISTRLIEGTYTNNGVPSHILQQIIVTEFVVYTTSAVVPVSMWGSREAAIKSSLLSVTLK